MSLRVLIVDDTAVFRRAVSDALAGQPGIEVVGTANNGKMALDRLATLQPDLMTLDIEMPEMNGIQVLQAMNLVRSISSPSPKADREKKASRCCGTVWRRFSGPSNGAGK